MSAPETCPACLGRKGRFEAAGAHTDVWVDCGFCKGTGGDVPRCGCGKPSAFELCARRASSTTSGLPDSDDAPIIDTDADLLAALDRAAAAFGDRGEGPVLRAAAARIRALTTMPLYPRSVACAGGIGDPSFIGATFTIPAPTHKLVCYECGVDIVAGDNGRWEHACGPPYRRGPR